MGIEMLEETNMTILAVPCDQPVILSREQGEKLLEEIRNKKPMTQEEKAQLAQRVKMQFTKPDKR